MKELIFDSGPIISLAMNHVLDVLEPLKKSVNASFLIPSGVFSEIVEVPWEIKRFKFEALQVKLLIQNDVLEVVKVGDVSGLLKLANTCFVAEGHPLTIIQQGEVEVLAFALEHKCLAVIDEHVIRSLVEDPEGLRKHLSKKLHQTVSRGPGLELFRKKTKGLRIIRSAELIAVALEKGLLDKYLLTEKGARKDLLDSLLWGLKTEGCALSENEIDELEK